MIKKNKKKKKKKILIVQEKINYFLKEHIHIKKKQN